MKIHHLKRCPLFKSNIFDQNFMKLGHIVKYYDVFFKFDNGPYRTMLSAVMGLCLWKFTVLNDVCSLSWIVLIIRADLSALVEKGLTSWLSFVVTRCLTVSLSLSYLYPGSGVELDYIDFWSLHPGLTYFDQNFMKLGHIV